MTERERKCHASHSSEANASLRDGTKYKLKWNNRPCWDVQLSGPEIKMTNEKLQLYTMTGPGMISLSPITDLDTKTQTTTGTKPPWLQTLTYFSLFCRVAGRKHTFFPPCKWMIKGRVQDVWSRALSCTRCPCCLVFYHHWLQLAIESLNTRNCAGDSFTIFYINNTV